MGTIVGSTSNAWQKCLATSVTTTSFSTTLPVETRVPDASGRTPALVTTDGFFPTARGANETENILAIMPMAGANNNADSLRVWGFNELNVAGVIYYVPVMLLQIAYTAGNVASTAVSGMFYADTITRTAGDSTCRVYSPVADSLADIPGMVLVDLVGCKWIYFEFAVNSGTAGSMNGLWRLLS